MTPLLPWAGAALLPVSAGNSHAAGRWVAVAEGGGSVPVWVWEPKGKWGDAQAGEEGCESAPRGGFWQWVMSGCDTSPTSPVCFAIVLSPTSPGWWWHCCAGVSSAKIFLAGVPP